MIDYATNVFIFKRLGKFILILIVYAHGLNEGSRLQNLTFFTDLEIYGRSREEFGQSVWGFRARGLPLWFTIFYTMKKTILLVMAIMC